ncbi:Hypothetical predicted protein [Octopus vulgaris]|uniref:Uncharacterized protein n=1 Tax=Octopus vulgaris TaxID=6645 RepID=A0AA36AJ90_OCTVU|nr:Hypothetical predicted protein [Octopus vulgaris]
MNTEKSMAQNLINTGMCDQRHNALPSGKGSRNIQLINDSVDRNHTLSQSVSQLLNLSESQVLNQRIKEQQRSARFTEAVAVAFVNWILAGNNRSVSDPETFMTSLSLTTMSRIEANLRHLDSCRQI